MTLVAYWILLFVFPWAFLWSFFWLSRWAYIKQYIAVNVAVVLTYTTFIYYLTNRDSDGWGVVIFGFLAVYIHFLVGVTTALFIKKVYLKHV